MHNYHETYGSFPPASVAGEDGRSAHSWRVLLLPFMDMPALYSEYRFDERWDGPHNRLLLNKRPNVFALHDRANTPDSFTNYLAIVGAKTAWPGQSERPGEKGLKIPDDKNNNSNTILVVENVGAGIHWTEPRDLDIDTVNLDLAANPPDGISSSYHPAAVVMIDGTVRKLAANEFTPERLRLMLTVARDGDPKLTAESELKDGRDRSARTESGPNR
jgi:hypothetical protein